MTSLCLFANLFEVILIDRSTTTPKTAARRRRQRRKDATNGANTVQNSPKTIEQDLKIARKRSENCTFSDGPIASDCFETFGLIWNLIP